MFFSFVFLPIFVELSAYMHFASDDDLRIASTVQYHM